MGSKEEGKRRAVKTEHHVLQSRLTWEDRLNVPSHNHIKECVKKHHGSRGGEAEAIFFQGASEEVVPLDANSLLLKQCKVLAAKPKGYWGQQTLEEEEVNMLESLYCSCS